MDRVKKCKIWSKKIEWNCSRKIELNSPNFKFNKTVMGFKSYSRVCRCSSQVYFQLIMLRSSISSCWGHRFHFLVEKRSSCHHESNQNITNFIRLLLHIYKEDENVLQTKPNWFVARSCALSLDQYIYSLLNLKKNW